MTPEDEEEWRPVPGYEGFYEVSSMGRVRSLDRTIRNSLGRLRHYKGRLIKAPINPGNGYYSVLLYREGHEKMHSVHRLVLRAFQGEPPQPNMQCCHNDGNPLNNRADNLRWDTSSNNHLDRIKHGRMPLAARTHCKWGHEYTPENTYFRPTAPRARQCRICLWVLNRARYVSHEQALIDARVRFDAA